MPIATNKNEGRKQSFFVIGESGWEVEWCSAVWIDPETGDGDPDRDTYHRQCFYTREAAVEFATDVFPEDRHGAVRITPFTIETLSDEWPYGRSVEYTADSEWYEGD